MDTKLDLVIKSISDAHGENLSSDGRNYLEVNIGDAAAKRGFHDIAEKFKTSYAIVPLKQPVDGMKVRIDGRTFVNYEQFVSGVAVPGYVARETKQPRKPYVPNDSMVLNCT